ncbi:centrosomal protein of 83 kDa-like [Corythoichthys intestinalis]|uniref:centrosomal protein of 83 kDa-like n=1 Tax=Corythoichthys intestinalis TaxID=161448 RepID=UPI0025A5D834|nr:centrosomal protein of 83 kDa-like [Corythoichthys intestinalis]
MDPSNLPLVPGPSMPVLDGAGMELQHMLADLQRKCETYKSNYNVLKIEHSSLQDEILHIQGEVKRLQNQHDKLQSQLAERSRELLDKKRESEELRLQVMTPKRLDLLRSQVQQEMEAPVRERFQRLEEEAEKYRSEFNKLRHAFTLLNSQFEHQKEEHASEIEGQKMRYEVEISHLKKEKDNRVAQYQSVDLQHERKQVEILLKEKAQLTMWLKSLQAEVDELQAKKDNSDQQVESIQFSHSTQLSETKAMVKSLESERQCLALRLERMEGELHLSQEQNNQLTGQLHKSKREVSSLTSQLESLKMSHKTEVDNVKLELTRSRGEVERECESLRGQKEGLQMEVAVLKEMLDKHNEVLVEKEMAMVRKVKAVSDEEMYKTTMLLEEKLDLEQRLMELEQQKTVHDMNAQAQKDDWQEQVRLAQKGEESLRKELQALRIKLKQQNAQMEELQRQNAEAMALKQKNEELCVHLGTVSRSEAELLEANERLREKLQIMREENIRCGAERLLEDSKERESKLEDKYAQLKDKLHKASTAEKKVKLMRVNVQVLYFIASRCVSGDSRR